MKTIRTLIASSCVAICLMAAPLTSRAGIIGDILHDISNLLHNHDNGKGNNGQDNGKGNPHVTSNAPTTNSNSVPLDGGIVLLMAAGLGFGVKKVYDRRKKTFAC
jgi:hypothetical protein